jgi:predicted GNAT family N-acyltransferase
MNSLQIKIVDYRYEIDAIKQIRTTVFQKEQGVATELEFDGFDEAATHFLAYLNHQAVGTARIKEINADIAKIERLAVLKQFRNQGIARQLMKSALNIAFQRNKKQVIVHAQEYIASLYEELGFAIVGDKFTEAGIAHVKMIVERLP